MIQRSRDTEMHTPNEIPATQSYMEQAADLPFYTATEKRTLPARVGKNSLNPNENLKPIRKPKA